MSADGISVLSYNKVLSRDHVMKMSAQTYLMFLSLTKENESVIGNLKT